MGESFLNKLKQSLESGEANESVNQIHYDILNKAGETSKQKQEKRIEEARAKKAEQVEGMNYINTVNDFLKGNGDSEFHPIKPEEINTHNDKVLEEYRTAREKIEKIELNDANIKLLEDEIKVFETKILKNKSLIAFLKLENSKL